MTGVEGQLEFTRQQQRSCEPAGSEGRGGRRGLHNVPSHEVDQGQRIFQKLEHCWGWGGTHDILGGGLIWDERRAEPKALGGKPFSFGMMIMEILKDRRGKIQYTEF